MADPADVLKALQMQMSAMQAQMGSLVAGGIPSFSSAEDSDGLRPLQIHGGGGMSYDAVVVGGVKYTGVPARTSNFLQVNRNTTPPTFSWLAAMPETADPGCDVYDVTKNRIYLPGEVAG